MREDLRKPNIRRQLEDSWHWTRFTPTSDRAYGAMNQVIAAERWCDEHVKEGRWFRSGDRFFFESQEALMLFGLTWL